MLAVFGPRSLTATGLAPDSAAGCLFNRNVFRAVLHIPVRETRDRPVNVIDPTRAVRDPQADGYFVGREDLAQLSPYQTRRLKRFGDYTLSMSSPEPFDTHLVVPFPLEDTLQSAATA